jgi:WD40 repeat protein
VKRELKGVPISFNGHEKKVTSVIFASASWDKTVCVWERETGKIVFGPLNVGSGAHSVVYSLDGTKLAAGTEKHIITWNTETGKELLKIQQRAYRVAFTPNGFRLVGGDRKDIRISDATTRESSSNSLTHTLITYMLTIHCSQWYQIRNYII